MAPHARFCVVRGPLMRVLAVDELLLALERKEQPRRKGLHVGEPGCDRSLVRGGMGEGFGGQLAAGVEPDASLRELGEDLPVAGGLADGHDVDEVLGGCAEERRAADVDHLDGVLLAHVPARRDALERIEVDADEVERSDLVVAQLVQVGLEGPPGEDACMDARVEGLDTSAEKLGDLGQLLDRDDVDAELGDVGGGPAARDDLDSEVGESTGEDIQPGLIEDRHEGAPHLHG